MLHIAPPGAAEIRPPRLRGAEMCAAVHYIPLLFRNVIRFLVITDFAAYLHLLQCIRRKGTQNY